MKVSWIDLMIERQSTPEQLRTQTIVDFCIEHKISESKYYYQASKPENQKHIVNTCLNNAKKYAPEVLEGLGERGKKDNRAAELYLKFILELREKTDVTTKGEKIDAINYIVPEK